LYYGTGHIEKYKGCDIYANNLLGGITGYATSIDDNIIHRSTIDEIKEHIDTKSSN